MKGRDLQIGLFIGGLVVGFLVGGFAAILPVSAPFTQQIQDAHLICGFSNSTATQCQYSGSTVHFQLCLKSYWWGRVCRDYRTVEVY